MAHTAGSSSGPAVGGSFAQPGGCYTEGVSEIIRSEMPGIQETQLDEEPAVGCQAQLSEVGGDSQETVFMAEQMVLAFRQAVLPQVPEAFEHEIDAWRAQAERTNTIIDETWSAVFGGGKPNLVELVRLIVILMEYEEAMRVVEQTVSQAMRDIEQNILQ